MLTNYIPLFLNEKQSATRSGVLPGNLLISQSCQQNDVTAIWTAAVEFSKKIAVLILLLLLCDTLPLEKTMSEDAFANNGLCCICFPAFLPVGEKWFQGYCQLDGKNSFGIFATGISDLCQAFACDTHAHNPDLIIRVFLTQRCFSWMNGESRA